MIATAHTELLVSFYIPCIVVGLAIFSITLAQDNFHDIMDQLLTLPKAWNSFYDSGLTSGVLRYQELLISGFSEYCIKGTHYYGCISAMPLRSPQTGHGGMSEAFLSPFQ